MYEKWKGQFLHFSYSKGTWKKLQLHTCNNYVSPSLAICGYAEILEDTDSGGKPTSITRTQIIFG